MKRLAPFIAPYWAYLGGGLFSLLLLTAAQLFVPRYLGLTIDAIVRSRSLDVLNRAAGVMLGVFAARSILLYGQIFFGFFLSHRVIADLRARVFEQIQRWSLDRFALWRSGDLISRSLQDTLVVQNTVLTGLLDLIGSATILTGIVVMLFVVEWHLAAFTLVVIPALLGSARLFGLEIQRTSQRAQARVADLAALLRQAFGGARIIRAFAQEEREIARFRRENERNFQENLRISQLIAGQAPVVSFLTAAGLVAVIWEGGRFVTGGAMTVGSLVAFLAYAALAVEPATSLSRLYAGLRQGLGALERVIEVVQTTEGVPESPHAREMPRIVGAVRFRHVSFWYEPTQWALNEVDLAVRSGERLALVGPSGAGKSTLINLLLRFYDPRSGTVEIDGIDLCKVRLRSLRRQIGLVPQETMLFPGTVRDNIAYARPEALEEEVIAAARIANAHEFITSLPQGYETILGEDGVQLSGGQRQRLAIARAVLNDPRLIILDEATSALDPESERLIQEALDRLTEGRTTFIVAHRLSTVRKADRIIVLDEGRIVEEGRHDELMLRGGIYARLAGLQLMGSVATD